MENYKSYPKENKSDNTGIAKFWGKSHLLHPLVKRFMYPC